MMDEHQMLWSRSTATTTSGISLPSHSSAAAAWHLIPPA